VGDADVVPLALSVGEGVPEGVRVPLPVGVAVALPRLVAVVKEVGEISALAVRGAEAEAHSEVMGEAEPLLLAEEQDEGLPVKSELELKEALLVLLAVEGNEGEGVMLEVLNGGRDFRLSIPGTKLRAGKLLTDGAIFDIGEKTMPGSMNLNLSGSKTYMSVDIAREQLPELMRRLQVNGHVGKFYLPEPDQDVLKTLKARYAEEYRPRTGASHATEPV
jgi:hypothetical protein